MFGALSGKVMKNVRLKKDDLCFELFSVQLAKNTWRALTPLKASITSILWLDQHCFIFQQDNRRAHTANSVRFTQCRRASLVLIRLHRVLT